MSDARDPLDVDALVCGGGVAGLFILDALVARGVRALLCETTALGSAQTTASQGILHAGTKYSLGGLVGDDAQEAARAAEMWEAMLDGDGCDLRGVRVLSRECYLWRSAGLVAAASLTAAKATLRTRPEAVAAGERPAWLAGVAGEVLRLPERVIDPMSLVSVLAARHAERIRKIEPGYSPALLSRTLILAAGAGNEELARAVGVDAPMQRRPLRQALLRGKLPMAFGHCIDGARTRVTVTSERVGDEVVWQIGGEVAEAGVAMSPDTFERHVRAELAQVLPTPLPPCSFASYLVDRAEPRTPSGRRPPRSHIGAAGAVRVVWPVKLVLAPVVAADIAESIAASLPTTRAADARWPEGTPRPPIAARPWEFITFGART